MPQPRISSDLTVALTVSGTSVSSHFVTGVLCEKDKNGLCQICI
jgi:hypothetical protein